MTETMVERLPAYKDLPVTPGAPPGSAWGLWGGDDQVGAINLLTPERVLQAARLVRKGAVFPLNWELELPQPGFGRNKPMRHSLWRMAEIVLPKNPVVYDDVLDNFFPQGSSQWDALSHFGDGEHGFYNGVRPEQLTGEPGTRNGIEHWARRGIVGRGVLLDIARWLQAQGRVVDYSTPTPIGPDALDSICRAQGVALETGDILLVRTGWMARYLEQTPQERRTAPSRSAGLESSRAMVEYLWDHHLAAVCADNPAVEAGDPVEGLELHRSLQALLGIAMGEMFYLEGLAADCAEDGVYEFLVTSAPLNLLGGVGSPPNALAIK